MHAAAIIDQHHADRSQATAGKNANFNAMNSCYTGD